MQSTICEAIRNRAIIRFYYGGLPRIVKPHCHGVSTAGNEVLPGYQTGGMTRSGRAPLWQLFEVAKIIAAEHTGEIFSANRPGYNPRDTSMVSIRCHV